MTAHSSRDPEPFARCKDCGWHGPREWLDAGWFDNLTEHCPECGSENTEWTGEPPKEQET